MLTRVAGTSLGPMSGPSLPPPGTSTSPSGSALPGPGMSTPVQLGSIVGSFTPTLAGQTVAGSHTYSQQVGQFVVIGNLVFVMAAMTLTALDGSMSGSATIAGFPVPSANDVVVDYTLAMQFGGITFDAGYTQLSAVITKNKKFATLFESGSALAVQFLTVANFSSTTFVSVSGFYRK